MRVAIVGCGVVGAAIAYELSDVPGLLVTVVEQHQPAQHSTGAALGVLMGAISQKLKGNNLRMRLFGIQRYNEWVPKLEIDTGRRILFNQQGILRLCFEGENLDIWKKLASVRQEQGWQLKMCDRAFLATNYPHLNLERVIGAIYSPGDRQVDPTALTLALVAAGQQNGVTFQFNTPVTQVLPQPDSTIQLQTSQGAIAADWLVIAAGIGSTALTTQLQQAVDIRPVLGQAVRVKMPQPLGNPALQPVITGEDVHLVPLGNDEYWIGATVEFSDFGDPAIALQPNPALLETVMQQAIALCPALQHATIQHQWYGLRPRPEGRPAPIIEPLPGHSHILLATGHYRNGVLLAPATAAKVRELVGV
ncbi:MAG: FAD-binding oxidoreductase [Oscillatoriales cyanobacterium C42_A2020_001]|nr:FAD-binding oxidoreductase [Leptolyngbyaceae cyanobacterium C42_A2020_001]